MNANLIATVLPDHYQATDAEGSRVYADPSVVSDPVSAPLLDQDEIWLAQEAMVTSLSLCLAANDTYISTGKSQLDKSSFPDKLKPSLTPLLLTEQLQVLLATSVHSLKADSSPTNSQRVLLDILQRTAELASIHVTVPEIPTSSGVRQAVFEAFSRVRRLLGRDSTGALLEDAASRVSRLVEVGVIPAYSGGRGSKPQEWVVTHVVKSLDPDLANAAFNVGTYRESMDKFYTTLRAGKSKGLAEFSSFFSTRSAR